MIIAIDFDGTCVTHDFPKVGKEIGAADILRKLVNSGHQLILYTCRGNCANNTGHSIEFPEVINGNFLDDAVNWFRQNDIPLFGIQKNPTQETWTTSPKCYAQLYIDDAALGCPLIYPDINGEGISNRPYVDWYKVDEYLTFRGFYQNEIEKVI